MGLTHLILISCLSVLPSVCQTDHQFGFFFMNGSLVFSDFWHDGRQSEYLKTSSLFFQENLFFPKFGRKGSKMYPKYRVFCLHFLKNFVSVFIFFDLKWKLILLLIFHNQSHIWQNSGSSAMGQNAVSQSNCRILQNVTSQERSEL